MSILHKRLKIRGRAIERNKGEARELPLEAARCSNGKKRKALPVEYESASARAVKADRAAAATSSSAG